MLFIHTKHMYTHACICRPLEIIQRTSYVTWLTWHTAANNTATQQEEGCCLVAPLGGSAWWHGGLFSLHSVWATCPLVADGTLGPTCQCVVLRVELSSNWECNAHCVLVACVCVLQAMLEEDAMRFDAFLKENDEKVQEAIKHADTEAKAKQDKVGRTDSCCHQGQHLVTGTDGAKGCSAPWVWTWFFKAATTPTQQPLRTQLASGVRTPKDETLIPEERQHSCAQL